MATYFSGDTDLPELNRAETGVVDPSILFDDCDIFVLRLYIYELTIYSLKRALLVLRLNDRYMKLYVYVG